MAAQPSVLSSIGWWFAQNSWQTFLSVKTVENLPFLAEMETIDCYFLSCGIGQVDLLQGSSVCEM